MRESVTIAFLSLSVALGALSVPGAMAASSGIQSEALGGRLFKGKVSFQLVKAEELMMQRKYEEADQIFRQQLHRDPKNIDALDGLAMTLAMQFKLDGANEQFEKVLALDPTNAFAHAGKAMVMLNRLQSSSQTVITNKDAILSQAEAEARLAVQHDPELQHAHYTLGMILKEQGRLPDAYSEFQEAVKADPEYAGGYAGLGMVDLMQDRLPDATVNFRKAISLNSGNSTAHYGLGEVLLKQGQADEAIKELNTALYQFPNSAPVHLALGKAYESQGNTTAALKSYERAALIKPELKEAYARMAALHVALGKGCQQQNNTVGALKEYKQAILIDPYNPVPYLSMADLREARGDLELAIAEMRSGLELNPNEASLRQRVAENLLKLDKLDDAIKEYQGALQRQPDNIACVDGLTRALYLKAQKQSQGAFVFSNDYETAAATLQRAIRIRPNDMQLRLAAAKIRALAGKPVDLSKVGQPTNDPERIAYAEALLAQNKFQESSEQMHDVIAHANSPDQLLAVADLSLMIKDLDSADAAYKKAASMEGQSERAGRGLAQVSKAREESRRQDTLGADLAKRKQLASAVDSFRLAISNNPRMADARRGLAEAEQRLSPDSPPALRDVSIQYRAYLSLATDLPQKQREKLTQKIAKIDAKAQKLETKLNVAKRP